MRGLKRILTAVPAAVALLAAGHVARADGLATGDWDFMYQRAKIMVPKALDSPFNFGQLKAGAPVPALVLATRDGDPVDLRAECAKGPTMVLFFRAPS